MPKPDAVDEFSLIQRYFNHPSSSCTARPVRLGIGDDAAVVEVPENHLLVQTIDTLVAGRHFPADSDPYYIAAKSLAVNVSDLVAMGASPAYFLLSLTLPDADENFLLGFSRGLFDAAGRYAIDLIGGDTCRGPLSITIQASGLVLSGRYLTRSAAQPGDCIFVSGVLGSAALGLASLQGRIELNEDDHNAFVKALQNPQPRLDLLPLLVDYASAAIDISDGLVGDLGHILKASQVGAIIHKHSLPVHRWIQQHDCYAYALGGGDDYQILFTVRAAKAEQLRRRLKRDALDVSEIGVITQQGFCLHDGDDPVDLAGERGFNHFAD